MPSVQLTDYFAFRSGGMSVGDAAFQSGLGLKEAELWEKAVEDGEEEAVALARAPARVREEQQSGEPLMEDVKTTIRVGNGPEVAIDLTKDITDPPNSAAAEQIGSIFPNPATDTGERLKRYIKRAEHLDEEIKDLNSDKSELFKEMKNEGFDTPTIKRIIKLRKMEPHARQEAEALLSTYMNALGMTPIEAAIALAA